MLIRNILKNDFILISLNLINHLYYFNSDLVFSLNYYIYDYLTDVNVVFLILLIGSKFKSLLCDIILEGIKCF
jgi:hypothetical protein